MTQETIRPVHAFYEDDEYSRQLARKKDYVSIQKGVQKQKQLLLCNLHELFVAFKERNPDEKIGFSKFCPLCFKWCVVVGSSGTNLIFVFTTHQNTRLLVETLNWEVTEKDYASKVVCDPSSRECIMHRCTNCPRTNALSKSVEELSDTDPDFQFHCSQWQTADRASLVTVTSTCEEFKNSLISAINVITKHSFLAKCHTNFLRAKKESLKANEVIVLGDFNENYQFLVQDEIWSYNWSKEYCTLHPLVVDFIECDGNIQHNSLCCIFDETNHDTNFVDKMQTILTDYLPIVNQIFYFSDDCA